MLHQIKQRLKAIIKNAIKSGGGGKLLNIKQKIANARQRKLYDDQMKVFLELDRECKKSVIDNLIISLTSYPERIKFTHYTIFSLCMQTIRPQKIILWLSQEEFPNGERELPSILLEFKKYGLEIHWCEGNLKSYKKLIYALKEFPNHLIITADDDAIYPKDWLQKLYQSYTTNPQYLHCHRAHRIEFDQSGKILPYISWEGEISHIKTVPSFLNFPTGVGGVLYPPNSLHNDVFKKELFLELAPTTDDVWFWAMAVLNQTKINVIQDNHSEIQSLIDGETPCLWHTNISQNKNDIAIQKIFEYYPAIQEQINFNSSEYWEIRYKKSEHMCEGGGHRSFRCREL